MRLSWVMVFCLLAATAAAQTPAVFDGGVVNAASFEAGQAVTPGSIVAIFGSQLASQLAQASSIPLSNSLDNVSVTFNNIPAPLFAVIPDNLPGGSNPAQINAQLPWEVQQGVAKVVVTRNGVQSQPVDVQVGPFGPGIFAIGLPTGQLIAAAIISDPVAAPLPAPVGVLPGVSTRPIKAGEILQIFTTGLGELDIPVASGDIPTDGQLHRTTTTPTVLVGGVPAQVEFSGMAPTLVGVDQVNIKIPVDAPKGDAIPLQLQIGGITSTDQVTIAIE